MVLKRRQNILHMTGDGWIFHCRKKCIAYRINDGAVVAGLMREVRVIEVRAVLGPEVSHDDLVLRNAGCGA